MAQSKKLPQIVLFGDSLTEWSFDEETRGFGLVLEERYKGKAKIVNEGNTTYTALVLVHVLTRYQARQGMSSNSNSVYASSHMLTPQVATHPPCSNPPSAIS
jgi:lysophospholipase L1-like esterase